MQYEEGSFLKTDARRLKRIKSLVDDIKAHHKLLVGKMWEADHSPQHFVPTSKTTFYDEIFEDNRRVKICKFRQVTTNPRSDKSGGLRILAVITYVDNNPAKYLPLIVYSAQEEKSSITYEGKSYKVTKAGIENLIKDRLESVKLD